MRLLQLLAFILVLGNASGQSLRFTFEGDSTTLPLLRDSLRGISGLEIVPSTGEWHVVSDRGWHFVFSGIRNIQDLQNKSHLKKAEKTPFWFEGIRYDAQRNTYFWADEYDFTTSLLSGKVVKNKTSRVLLRVPLPSHNKGIEGLALTPSGALWVAPEAGWEGETQLSQDTVSFFRYTSPLAADPDVERFLYPIDRCAFVKGEERLGGISEILAVDEHQLLVLERCYDADRGTVTANVYTATVDDSTHRLKKELAFDFTRQFPGGVCNLEAMAWMDADKQTLVLMADDNFRRSRTLRNQIIFLKRR